MELLQNNLLIFVNAHVVDCDDCYVSAVLVCHTIHIHCFVTLHYYCMSVV